MPRNKNALARYRLINRELLNGRYVSLERLVQICSEELDDPVSESTIKKDIRDMRRDQALGYHAPIRYRHRYGYYYEDLNYSIDRLPINDEELNSLTFAATLLEQYGSVPVFRHFSDAVSNIRRSLRFLRRHRHDYQAGSIEFEKPPATVGEAHLSPLLEAIINKTVVEIQYQAFGKKEAQEQHIHPYLLKEYLHRWYLFGYNDYWKGYRVYALDRIKSVKPDSFKTFIPYPGYPGNYFEDVIGVTRFGDSKKEKVVLKFTRQQADYVLTQPLHKSQKVVEETENHVIISLEVYLPSPELEIKILGWNEEVEVLGPEGLKNKVVTKLKRTQSVY